jgi:hypothetical protein
MLMCIDGEWENKSSFYAYIVSCLWTAGCSEWSVCKAIQRGQKINRNYIKWLIIPCRRRGRRRIPNLMFILEVCFFRTVQQTCWWLPIIVRFYIIFSSCHNTPTCIPQIHNGAPYLSMKFNFVDPDSTRKNLFLSATIYNNISNKFTPVYTDISNFYCPSEIWTMQQWHQKDETIIVVFCGLDIGQCQ